MTALEAIRKTCGVVVAALVCPLLAPDVRAQAGLIAGYPPAVTAYDPREVAKLPGYCKYTQDFREKLPGGNDPLEIERWTSIMGETFHAMHHYCWALMKNNRAMLLARSEQVRHYYLSDAIGEFDYVIRHATDDFILMPEILTKKGENLIRLGKGPVAVLHLEHAAKLKPDYWPPYAQLADYYLEEGEVDLARQWLEKGLSFAPDATALARRLRELDDGATAGQRGMARPAEPR